MNVSQDIGSTVLIQAIPHSQQYYCNVIPQIRKLPMEDTGQVCTVPGIYSSSDCNYEIALNMGEKFPPCPVHEYEVTWELVRPA